jgi:predicted metal-dependent HD superfamily phosphohydrolase
MKPAKYYEACIEALSPEFPPEWPTIAKAYEGRAYHNLNHLEEMLGHLPGLSTSTAPAAEPIFGIALVYHDIVYRAGRKDNEARSADQALAFLQKIGVGQADQTRCRKLIMATKTHKATTEEEALLVDLDLAVLAREPDYYDEYTLAIRKEFNLFPNFLYRPGRKKALLHFLDKPYIYHGTIARSKWEEAARLNLERELSQL